MLAKVFIRFLGILELSVRKSLPGHVTGATVVVVVGAAVVAAKKFMKFNLWRNFVI